MPVEFMILKKANIGRSMTFRRVEQMAKALRDHLDADDTQRLIRERHVLGASSTGVQELVLTRARALGFQNGKQGLCGDHAVSALRPDYYCPMDESGVLLEVERGKTTTNTMDLLDLWKCHIRPHARCLSLVVPVVRRSANGRGIRHFGHVAKRLTPFFDERNYVNLDAVSLFGH